MGQNKRDISSDCELAQQDNGKYICYRCCIHSFDHLKNVNPYLEAEISVVRC
jgi:hypothetical protein